tara:strand:+ start:271 stop:534 length:264 start_codon:yes stop_codon:yes gene_type:complete
MEPRTQTGDAALEDKQMLRTIALAIVALVFGIVFAPFALLFGAFVVFAALMWWCSASLTKVRKAADDTERYVVEDGEDKIEMYINLN